MSWNESDRLADALDDVATLEKMIEQFFQLYDKGMTTAAVYNLSVDWDQYKEGLASELQHR